jgi:hypothetical protein
LPSRRATSSGGGARPGHSSSIAGRTCRVPRRSSEGHPDQGRVRSREAGGARRSQRSMSAASTRPRRQGALTSTKSGNAKFPGVQAGAHSHDAVIRSGDVGSSSTVRRGLRPSWPPTGSARPSPTGRSRVIRDGTTPGVSGAAAKAVNWAWSGSGRGTGQEALPPFWVLGWANPVGLPSDPRSLVSWARPSGRRRRYRTRRRLRDGCWRTGGLAATLRSRPAPTGLRDARMPQVVRLARSTRMPSGLYRSAGCAAARSRRAGETGAPPESWSTGRSQSHRPGLSPRRTVFEPAVRNLPRSPSRTGRAALRDGAPYPRRSRPCHSREGHRMGTIRWQPTRASLPPWCHGHPWQGVHRSRYTTESAAAEPGFMARGAPCIVGRPSPPGHFPRPAIA